jgi:hypothetical protein
LTNKDFSKALLNIRTFLTVSEKKLHQQLGNNKSEANKLVPTLLDMRPTLVRVKTTENPMM